MQERNASLSLVDRINQLYLHAKDGDESALKMYMFLKHVSKVAKELSDALLSEALGEADRYGKGQQKDHGYAFHVKNGPSRWDFSGCEHFKEREKEIKDLSENLKKIAEGKGEFIDKETGEIWELPIKIPGKQTIESKKL